MQRLFLAEHSVASLETMLQLFETMLQHCCESSRVTSPLGLLNDPRDLSAQDDAQFLKLTYYWQQNYFLSASATMQSDLPFLWRQNVLNLDSSSSLKCFHASNRRTSQTSTLFVPFV